MTVVRHYKMVAAPGEGDALCEALKALAARVGETEGCASVDLFTSSTDSAIFVFVEHWQSWVRYAAGPRGLGKDRFAPVIAVLATRPKDLTLERVAVP